MSKGNKNILDASNMKHISIQFQKLLADTKLETV